MDAWVDEARYLNYSSTRKYLPYARVLKSLLKLRKSKSVSLSCRYSKVVYALN